ncbi:hypothetical protein [Methanobrevibacter sp.]|uniref:hypothetical protein n=1 Tax=Methanobrevibacter sp. TaxID=66852 RepID=UPI00386E7094
MSFQEYVASQFQVCIIREGERKGRVCFQTPLANYTLTREDWEIVKQKINEV